MVGPLAPRAFGPNVDRLIRRTTIVNSADDIRRAITLCLTEQRPCVLEMGSNIAVTSTITIPGGLKAFSIDGGGRWAFVVNATVTTLFDCQASPTQFSNLSIVVKSEVSVSTLFQVTGSPVVIDNVAINAVGTATSLFMIPGSGVSGTVSMSTCTLDGVENFFNSPNPTGKYVSCRISDVVVKSKTAAPVTIGQGSVSPGFESCRFERISGDISFDSGPLSINSVLDSLRGNGTTSALSTTNSGNAHVILNATGFVSSSTTSADIVIGNAAPIATEPTANITLNSAGPTLTPGAASYVRVTHGASASGSVTVSGVGAINGRPVLLLFVSVAGTAVYTDNVGNLRLTANFTPTADDTLTIAYDSTTGLWYECSRSVN